MQHFQIMANEPVNALRDRAIFTVHTFALHRKNKAKEMSNKVNKAKEIDNNIASNTYKFIMCRFQVQCSMISVKAMEMLWVMSKCFPLLLSYIKLTINKVILKIMTH